MADIERVIDVLRGAGWNITPRVSGTDVKLCEVVRARYPIIDPIHATFLDKVKSCVDRDRLTWLLCEDDYNGTNSWPIQWNEWELHAIEVTIGMRDQAQRVAAFWRDHLPVGGTLRSEYSYLVIRLTGPDAGAIFCGQDPEGLRLERLAGSFGELLDLLIMRVTGLRAPVPMARFI